MQVTRLTKWLAAATTAAALVLSFPRTGLPQPPAGPDLTAGAAVLIDAQTGQVLYDKHAERQSEPASTTKILTALVALEKGHLDDQVTVSQDAWGLEGSSAYLEPGEQQSLESLLYALMLPSGNDAAAAIAEHIAGSEEAFAAAMNETAASLGATHSHFTNPHGLPDSDHYTTPLDLAKITRAALQHPEFAKIVGTKSFELPGGYQQRLFYNHNKLLWNYDGATGVKTGYTESAGSTLVASATRGDRSLIAVFMDDRPEALWDDAERLLDYGFELPPPSTVVMAGETLAQVPVAGGSAKEASILAARELRLFLQGADLSALERRLDLPSTLQAPLSQGQRVGRVDFYLQGVRLGGVDLVAGAAVAARSSSFWAKAAAAAVRVLRVVLRVLLWGGVVLLALILLLALRARLIRRRRRHSRYGRSVDYVPLHRVIQRNLGD